MADATAPLEPVVISAARHLCVVRGGEPDGTITMGYPDGSQAYFDPAWHAYVDIAQTIVQMVRDADAAPDAAVPAPEPAPMVRESDAEIPLP